MPTMTGKTVLITGATSGIGLESALEMAALGATVLVHGRTADKAAAAAELVNRAGADAGGTGVPLDADLSSMAEVRRLAERVRATTDRLDVLVNNAGTFQPERVTTTDGYETTFAVNHLAAFLLTDLLAPVLCASKHPRIITVTSMAHYKGVIDLDDLQSERAYDAHAAYSASKLANVLFAAELANRAPCAGATSNAVHPGVIATKLLAAGFPGSQGASLAEGAETIVYLASSDDVEGVTGELFARKRPAHASPASRDEALRRGLWDASAQLTGIES